MTSAFQIRPARSDDTDALGRLGGMLVAEHYEFDHKRFLAPLPEMPQLYGHFLESQTQQADKFVLVAERDGSVIGYVFGGMEDADYMVLRGPAGAIYDLVVDPDHRREGIGKSLLEAAFAALSERGAPRIVLFTAQQNSGAQALFERSGFRPTMIEMTRELG